MKRLMVTDTIRWSRDIYIEHVTGITQINPLVTQDSPRQHLLTRPIPPLNPAHSPSHSNLSPPPLLPHTHALSRHLFKSALFILWPIQSRLRLTAWLPFLIYHSSFSIIFPSHDSNMILSKGDYFEGDKIDIDE